MEKKASKRKNAKSTVQSINKSTKTVRDSWKLQHNLRNILQYSNATLIRGKDSNGYVCNFCPKKFPLSATLKSHSLEEHNDIKSLRIPKSSDHLLKVDITALKCKICESPHKRLDIFLDHMKSEHKKVVHTDVSSQIIPFKFDTETLRCAVCEVEFTNFKKLQEHMHVHFSNFICDVCSAGFVTKRLLVRHKSRHGNGNYKCDHCDKTFICDQKRRDHEQRIHLGLKKKNKCQYCDEKFADYWTKVNHMVKEHGAPPVVLKCQACDRTFANKRALTRHVKQDHLMERKHACSVCDMKFFLKHRLDEHMITHTGVKKFQCHVCTRWYGTKKTLRQHLRSHADDRSFSCSECGQAFVQNCTLKSHIRSKHGNVS